MKRLIDLDPRWLVFEGRRVGFVFISPSQRVRTDGTVTPAPGWHQSCFAEKLTSKIQRQLFEDIFGDDDYLVQGCRPDFAWTIAGGIVSATFETMTVTPSLDGSAGGLWHGYITNGEIR